MYTPPIRVHGATKHDSTVTKAGTGTYVGDNTANKAIAHGLGRTPSVVLIFRDTVTYNGLLIGSKIKYSATAYNVTACDATNFYVGNGVNHAETMNETGVTFTWAAV